MTYQELLTENQSQKTEISSLKEQLSQLYKLLSGFKSERFVSEISQEQLNLFSESHPQAIAEASKETITYTREKKKHCGRNALPEHLPVKEIVIEPKEDITGLKKIGEEVTETLSYMPASLVKIRTIRPKYAKPNAEGILIGDLPSRPIDKCIAEACLLAYILVNKYVDNRVLCEVIVLDSNYRNCNKDEVRPLGFDLQELNPNRHMLHWSKAFVVSDMVKGFKLRSQVTIQLVILPN